jgi:uncharacterized OsmC-like protein
VSGGLNEHVLRKRALLSDFIDNGAGTDRVISRLSAATVASDATGVRRIRIREFQLLSDSGPGMGGYDLGPSSPELFLGALSSCISHIFLTQAAVRDVPLDVVATKAEASLLNGTGAFGDPAIPGYPHDISYTVDVLSSAADDELLALWQAVRARCPIYLLIARAVPITGTLRRISETSPPRVLGTHRSASGTLPDGEE